MHASIPYNDEKPREFNMIELFGWSQVHSPFVELTDIAVVYSKGLLTTIVSSLPGPTDISWIGVSANSSTRFR